MTKKELWNIRITKGYLKFSAAHMTVYPDGSKEPLHGHNYQVHIDIEVNDASFARMIDFNQYKQILRYLCDEWDEMILIPGKNPLVSVEKQGTQTHVEVCKKQYQFPSDEVHVLDIENITTELLAKEIATRMAGALRQEGLLDWSEGQAQGVIESIRLGVFETQGQGASYLITPTLFQT